MKSKYEQLAQPEKPERVWDRYGLSFRDWEKLSVEEREIHYNRNRPNDVPAYAFEPQGVYTDTLRESYSFDPYFHTPIMIPHSIEKFFQGTCECQTCTLGFGIERGTEKRKLNEEQIKEKIRNRGKHVECFCDACFKQKDGQKP